jgi:cytoskeletal protein CcmA (bactofilin family)
MSRLSHLVVSTCLLATAGLGGAPAQAQFAGETIVLREPVDKDLYAAGQSVQLRAAVAGDAVAAGRRVTVSGDVTGDVIAAGETVTLKGAIGDDLRAAGRTVSLWGAVADHAVLAGADVVIQPEASVASWAWLAGSTIDAAGDIGGELRAAGETVIITGRVGGDVDIVSNDIRVENGAYIGGDLTWRGDRPPSIAEDAEIAGNLVEGALPDQVREEQPGIGGLILGVVAVFMAAAAIYLVGPNLVNQTSAVLANTPGRAFLTGLAVLLGVPLLIAVLLATVIGWVLALILLATYLLLLLSGGLMALLSIERLTLGHWATSRNRRLLTILLVVVAAALLSLIPVIGPLVPAALILVGLGALAMQLRGWLAATA